MPAPGCVGRVQGVGFVRKLQPLTGRTFRQTPSLVVMPSSGQHRSVAKQNTPSPKLESNMSITYNAYMWPHSAVAVKQERSVMNLNRIVVQPRLGFVNSQNLCAELGVSPRTVRRWTRAGQLPQPRRLGRSCFWSIDEVRALLTPKERDAK